MFSTFHSKFQTTVYCSFIKLYMQMIKSSYCCNYLFLQIINHAKQTYKLIKPHELIYDATCVRSAFLVCIISVMIFIRKKSKDFLHAQWYLPLFSKEDSLNSLLKNNLIQWELNKLIKHFALHSRDIVGTQWILLTIQNQLTNKYYLNC